MHDTYFSSSVTIVSLHWAWQDSLMDIQLTVEQTWTFIPFRMWDKNTTVPKRAAHPHFDWPSDGSCRSQALSQLSVKLVQLLAGTI